MASVAAATGASKPTSGPKGRKRDVCAVCQGPFKKPKILQGKKLCRFCFDKQAVTNRPPSKDGSRTSVDRRKDDIPELEKAQGFCGVHREDLSWFCTKEAVLICGSCKAAGIHASHSVVSTEDAAQEYKVKLQHAVHFLQKHLEETLEQKREEGKKTAAWKDKVHSRKERIVTEYTKLYKFLEEEEEKHLEKLKKEEREVLKRLHRNLLALSENSMLLKQLLAEMKEKSQMPAAGLLKDVEHALNRSKNVNLQEIEVIPTELKNIYNIPCIDIIQILTAFKVSISLDPVTAHPSLSVSEDKKSVKYRGVRQDLMPGEDNVERFDTYIVVLGSERFTSGRHYWEVEVGNSTEWDLGVCRESVDRKGQLLVFSPLTGFWRLWLRNGNEYKAAISQPSLVPVTTKPTRVGIFLDYSESEVSFYNATDRTHIYTYIGAFYGPLRPFFSPSRQQHSKNAEPLIINPGSEIDTSRKRGRKKNNPRVPNEMNVALK